MDETQNRAHAQSQSKMNPTQMSRYLAIPALTLVTVLTSMTIAAPGFAQDPIADEFHGDWVSTAGDCDSPARFRVEGAQVSLINGEDSATFGDIAIAHSYFGPEYTGISIVAIPEINSENYPFTVFFNADEERGVTKLDIYYEMQGPMNPQIAAIQDAAKKLAERFPLNAIPLKKCPS